MIVSRGTTLGKILTRNRVILTIIVSVAVIDQVADEFYSFGERSVFSLGAVRVLVFAISVFLIFRFNEAYGRWWEARKLWGQLVAQSRIFGRQVATLLDGGHIPEMKDPEQERCIKRELINRQIAYVNALRITLRRSHSAEDFAKTLGDFGKYLSPSEFEEIRGTSNFATQLVRKQGETFRRLLGPNLSQNILFMQLDSTLNRLHEAQTGCERIKNTVFPDSVSFICRIFVWALIILIPLSIVESDNHVSFADFAEVIIGSILVFVFVLIEQLGRDLQDPFSNSPNDTPMTALCRTIEIDLLEQLGEADVPPPIEPEKGVLL